MAARVPRLAIIAVVGMLALAGLALGAGGSLVPASSPPAPAQTLPQQRAVLVVPDVTKQAFVFAKGAIQDAGMSWRVVGKVRGYPANTVVSQTPPAGTRVYDTGAPVVTLQLAVDKKYPQTGTPQDISPYPATAVELADAPALPGGDSQPAAPATTPAPAATTAPAPAATTSSAPATTPAAPPAATTSSAPAQSPLAHPKTSKYPQVRPPAFAVAGAPKEPLDEMPLVDRAKALDRWLSHHTKPTNANVEHWLYQNEWIVTGARFGWWHGAQALRVLIRVDRRAQALWGVGAKSEAVAAGALTEVEARSK